MNRPHTMTCALGEQPKAQRKNRRKNTGIVIRGLMARTNPDNWPIQEVHTLDEIIADRSISIQHIGESFHASDR